VFGYTNEELRKILGVRLNRELYLCYFIIYIVMTRFYTDSGTYTFVEYIKAEDIIQGVTEALSHITSQLQVLVTEEIEEESFRMMAMLWGDMPVMTGDEQSILRSARNSQAGYVKRVLNFLVDQELLAEAEGRYYPKDRLRAVIENYFEEYKGRLYQIISGKGESDDAVHEQSSGE
jgi:sensor histidine kinase YesM